VEPCPVDCIDMIYEEESLKNWHWQLPDPVGRRIEIIASDAPQGEASRDRAA
jgi:electron transport complex protein RnfB